MDPTEAAGACESSSVYQFPAFPGRRAVVHADMNIRFWALVGKSATGKKDRRNLQVSVGCP